MYTENSSILFSFNERPKLMSLYNCGGSKAINWESSIIICYASVSVIRNLFLKLRYTKVAAEKITKTVLQTAISGGNGIISSLQHSYSMNDLRRASLTSEVSEENRAVVPKRTMSMHRRERPHHSQSPVARHETQRKRTGTVTSRSTSRTNSTEGANKTCSLYGTLPRYPLLSFNFTIQSNVKN